LKNKFETADLTRIKTIKLSKRHSLARSENLAVVPPSTGARRFFDSLPGFLKADDLRRLIDAIINARHAGKPIIMMCGGHVIKVGLSPVLIDLIKNDFITALCFNGAGIIHDSEMAMVGQTSEDVAAGLADGSFGMSAETADFFAEVTTCANDNNIGLGQAAGEILNKRKPPFADLSLFLACRRRNIPALVHIAVDTDIVCQHPVYNPAAAARASHQDFKILAAQIARGEDGGVFINIGSAVILPEVFLKALTVARNIYKKPHRIVTANFDMISHYRPSVNVVRRPTLSGGQGFNFTGHHEIMIPLLAWGLKAFHKNKSKAFKG